MGTTFLFFPTLFCTLFNYGSQRTKKEGNGRKGIKKPLKLNEFKGLKGLSGRLRNVQWCLERESNPHGRKAHEILSLGCLPVPPSRHEAVLTTALFCLSIGKSRGIPETSLINPSVTFKTNPDYRDASPPLPAMIISSATPPLSSFSMPFSAPVSPPPSP